MTRRLWISAGVVAAVAIGVAAWVAVGPSGDGDGGESLGLDGTTWLLAGYGEPDNLTDPRPDAQITIVIDVGAQTMNGQLACNSHSATISRSGSSITFTDHVTTDAACGAAASRHAEEFSRHLRNVDRFEVTGDTLVLLATDGSQLTFEGQEPETE